MAGLFGLILEKNLSGDSHKKKNVVRKMN